MDQQQTRAWRTTPGQEKAGEGERRRMRDVIHQSELILHDCICANGQNQCVGTAVGPDVSEENRCAEKARPMCTDTVARTYSPGAKCPSRAAATQEPYPRPGAPACFAHSDLALSLSITPATSALLVHHIEFLYTVQCSMRPGLSSLSRQDYLCSN